MKTPAAVLRLASAARTHVGCVRPVNEDRLLDDPAGGCWAVADGMGGMDDGAGAAEAVIAALAQLDHADAGYARLDALCAAVQAANAQVFDGGGGRAGATLVALLVEGAHFACVWAGDSRGYLLRRGELLPITHDHSPCQDLVDAGLLPEADRRRHPKAHLISRAVGVAPHLDLDRRFGAIEPDDRFLLCSDGLTACLGEDEIAARLAAGAEADAASALLDRALARGAPDNVSLIVLGA